ncbi:toll/interleukin-1 receptor domain-containing protein [Clostridium tagluense]|uniref:toll/interleukin-1 receptor domain-containing protein n=1 Tax=Clostridium tagluense TaxID=360422 RepID=UPI001CF13841|nr:toll/interleukin-1 receptor domain-containing protein [Clostridium tagluense]MCB2313628.1 toll/interleukin-1 receptor domain-containing protein [Clostridium tagluense]MCB2318471.1 toll/interleukin-1 receptor domain-containing protein [Clostridium tagluense]MCB2323293.1 toll/interleukin-1 receptor domain-containing protein [Clostridium tagluense]MCB2328236.1 toll/interleukin-1 receptor domain-containing protein [Clostridium tagluense]MCB2332995.1 toll/interleukin-1 receptor domain-containing
MQSKNCTNSVLKNKIFKIFETMTQKELKYISPKLLFEDLNITEEKTSCLLDSIVDDGKLNRKYIFSCPNNDYCDEEIIILDNELNEYIACDLCGGEFKPQENINLLKEICYELIEKSDNYGLNLKKYFCGTEAANVIPLLNNETNDKYKVEKHLFNENGGKSMKIFISHSEKDSNLVRFLINLLEGMGVKKDKEHIFCSSYIGFGVDCGEDILKFIKEEFKREEIIVLYVITKNFLNSKACLCEMGGAWVLSKLFIPLVMPSASFDDIKGTLLNPSVKGLKLDDYMQIDELMQKITKEFGIVQDYQKWGNAKNEFIQNFNLIKSQYESS